MSDSNKSQKKLFMNASWLFGGKTASGIFSAIQTVVIARILGVSDYGLLSLVLAYVAVLNMFFDLKVWETATKYIGTYWETGEHDKARSMIKLSYILDIGSGVVAFIIAILSAKLISTYIIHSPQAYVFIWIYSISLFVDTANSTSDAILRVFDRFKNIAFINSFQKFFRLIVVVALLYSGLGIKGVLYGFILASFVGFSVRMWLVMKTLKHNDLQGWLSADISLIRDQWKGIAWFLGNTSFIATLKTGNERYLGILILGYFVGKDAVAFYKIASSIASVVNRIVDPIYEAIYPELVKLASSNAIEDFKNMIKSTTKSLVLIIIPIGVIIIIFAEPIISLVFGKDYVPATNALRILAAAVLIVRCTFWINPALLSMGRPGLRTIMGVISTFIYLVLMFLLVPGYSYMGAAFAFLGYSIVRSSLAFKFFHDALKKIE
ncbi:MAG: oligosaccharide flippase family protein [Candidatus Dadabacteria bacterium]|nr:oligosaccharide flippase family protein [Candidatus Dadabacteria bacterium]